MLPRKKASAAVSVFERKRPFGAGLEGCVTVDDGLFIGKLKEKR